MASSNSPQKKRNIRQLDPRNRSQDLFAAFLGAFAACMLIISPWEVNTSGPYPFYKGALIFPIFALSLIVLASIPSAYRMLHPPDKATWKIKEEGVPRKTFIIFFILVAFLIGIFLIGLGISSILFLGVTLYYLGYRSPKILILIPLILTSINYIIFNYLLNDYFPRPLIYKLLGG